MKRYIKSEIQGHYYIYDGPVYEFDRYIGDYKGWTKAPSLDKAKNILKYKAKTELGRNSDDLVELEDRYFDEVFI